MAIRGPKPLPANIMELVSPKSLEIRTYKGEGAGEPLPDGALVASSKLDMLPGAREYFDFYVRNSPVGHLKPLDTPMLELLCVYLDTFDKCAEQWLAPGGSLIFTTSMGTPMKSPYFEMMTKLGESIRKYSIELALTPIERGRISGGGAKSADVEAERKRQQRLEELRAKYIGQQSEASS